MDGKSMRYNHESYLPIGAFQPILGRMTLHGGGGGGILDTFSDIIGTGGGDQGLLNMVDQGVESVGGALASVDDFVNEEIPGGWYLPAAVAVAVATGYVDPTLFATEGAGFTGASETGLATLAGEGAAPDIAGNVLLNEAGLTGAAETGTPELVPDATVQSSPYGAGSVPYNTDVPVYYNGVEMTPAQVAADNPSLYPNGQINEPGTATYFNLPEEYRGLGEEGINQKYIAANAANAANVVPESVDPIRDLIRQQQLNQSMNSFNELPDINGVPQRDMAQLLNPSDTANYPSKYSIDKILDPNLPSAAYDTAKAYLSSLTYPQMALGAAGLYGLSNLGGGSNQEKSKAQLEEEKKKLYTYGVAAPSTSDYMLKNKINAGNVYSNSNSRYTPLTRYAIGGGVGIKNLIKNK